MSFIGILLLALGLAMDACAVAIGAGASGRARGRRAAFRLSFHFGLFQFLMPVLGWLGGITVAARIAAVDHWVAFALLALVGGRMIRSGWRDLRRAPTEPATATTRPQDDPSRGSSLVMLSIATSIDALAVGLSLAMLRVNIWYPSAVIGLVAAAMTLLGLRLGHRLGARFGQRMEIIGGVILLLVGMRILLSHLLMTAG